MQARILIDWGMYLPGRSQFIHQCVAKRCVHCGSGIVKKKSKTSKVIRMPWTPKDIRELKRLAKTKIGAEKIAKQLKRTTGATIAMASKQGVSLSTRD